MNDEEKVRVSVVMTRGQRRRMKIEATLQDRELSDYILQPALHQLRTDEAQRLARASHPPVDVDDVIGIWPKDEEAQDGTAD